jgi:flagellar biosynthesis component FlhA
METTLAVLMVLGIFVGVPAVVGLTIAGLYMAKDNKVRKAQHAKALEAVAEKQLETVAK